MFPLTRARRGDAIGYALVIVLALLAWRQIQSQREAATAAAQDAFVAARRIELAYTEENVVSAFRQLYQGLRTIARLPNVRRADLASGTLDDLTKLSVQEIYNNLADNVALSEIYLIPMDFDPGRMDGSQPGRPRKLITFDDLIVGKTGEPDSNGAGSVSTFEEIEAYEYQAMRKQLDQFAALYTLESSFLHLAYPALVSPELITCDNSRMLPSAPLDDDRRGIVISVPLYGADGRLRGMVSAVILSKVFAKRLSGSVHALVAPTEKIVIRSQSSNGGLLDPGTEFVTAARPELAFAEQRQLALPAFNGQWFLWAGASSHEFLGSPLKRAIESRFRVQLFVLAACLCLLTLLLRWWSRRHALSEQMNTALERRVAERTVELEQARREAEAANAAKSAFLAHISHEFRTPMHAIMASTELLVAKGPQAPLQNAVSNIATASGALLDLVNQLLDLAAIEGGRFRATIKPFSPASLAGDVVAMLMPAAAGKGVGLELRVAPGVPSEFRSDAGRVRQVLVNLVGNAVKFTDRGSVEVRVEGGPGDGVRLVVADTGPGISEARRARMFEPFAIASESMSDGRQGAGLGLAISKQLVERLGGSLRHLDRDSGGTIFQVDLPAWSGDLTAEPVGLERSEAPDPARPAEPDATPPDIARERLRGAHVVLAEDNGIVRGLCADLLRQLGCTVTLAVDGHEAVAAATTRAVAAILMDCRMPGLDGIEAIRAIRDHEAKSGAPRTPIIALTANAFAADRQRCMEAGADAFLSKPFRRSDLIGVLAEMIGCGIPRATAIDCPEMSGRS